MISKRVELEENNFEKTYSYIYLFIGESERMVTRKINDFCKHWYSGSPEEVDFKGQRILWDDIWIKWDVSDCSKDDFIKEILGNRIITVE